MNLRSLQFFADGGDTQAEVDVSTGQEQVSAEPENETVEQEKKYTDVDAIIDKKFAKWKKEQEALADEAKKLAKMNAEQKAE
ncbi:capsid assembly scaffolding protein Gp46 family protein, partial [Streptococcus sp. DD10]|uniref:capsid assembly scaffolding protein Gp46 family protein n=1 Tax=Streptococcus sp. DD10 TaxID=1777878 RepID=UPI0012E71A04